ncbi:MAG TPA: DUF2785 domain-containing protein [Candidatus Nanopelagicales bacterium]|nr:DUF2785 domain-containing protein [Candidatus Nanopelagicales bacterium]
MLHDLDALLEGLASGRFAADHDEIRASALAHLGSDEIQARTFAPLVLQWLALAGDRDRAAFDAVSHWYLSEEDARGYDESLGWLHAVAHGADYLSAAAATGVAAGDEVLGLLARRTSMPGPVWRDQENARVAHAAVQALSAAHGAGQDGVRAFAAPFEEALTAFELAAADGSQVGRPPAWLTNVFATLATLYVAVSEDPLPGEDVDASPWRGRLRAELAALLSRMTPWLFTPSSRVT